MSDHTSVKTSEVENAQIVRDACIRAAEKGFRDASMSGLCSEGAIEAAVSAIQLLDIEKIIAEKEGGQQ
jgi:hypothetical protein